MLRKATHLHPGSGVVGAQTRIQSAGLWVSFGKTVIDFAFLFLGTWSKPIREPGLGDSRFKTLV